MIRKIPFIDGTDALTDYLEQFTAVHIQHTHSHIFTREARCNEFQYTHVMLTLRPNDLLAGRKCIPPIGFLPQVPGGVAYYCDINALSRHENESSSLEYERCSLSEKSSPNSTKIRCQALRDYWELHATSCKISKAYTPEQKAHLTEDDTTSVPAVAFPLYRMSGAQMNPRKLLDLGIDGMKTRLENHEKDPNLTQALLDTLTLLQQVVTDYVEEVYNLYIDCNDQKRKQELMDLHKNLLHIRHRAPSTLWQAMLLVHLFYLLSGTYNYGRMDDYLGTYYARDIDNGTITEDFALRLVENFWTLIIERENYWDSRIVLGGANRIDVAAADRFALVAMEASHRLRDRIPQLTLRCDDETPTSHRQKALRMIADGCTYPILYNDKINIPAVAETFQIPHDEACDYIPYGCGEYVIYGKSFGTPSGTLNLAYLLTQLIRPDGCNLLAESEDFPTFYQAYMQRLEPYVRYLAEQEKLEYEICASEAGFLFFTLLFEDCIERGRAVFDGGIRYLGGTLETYGTVNTIDSMAAIKTLVYEQKRVSAEEMAQALAANFEGYETLRHLCLTAPKYGNDLDAVDDIAVKLHEDLCRVIRSQAARVGLHTYLNVMINNLMNTTFGLATGATPDGRVAGMHLANGNNPMGGMDKNGITAVLNSLVKLRPSGHAGLVQNMKFTRDWFTAPQDLGEGILRAYFANGGAQAMITVLNRGDLERAIEEPEKYRHLLVRIGGLSARFVELEPAIQRELMSRTLYGDER